MKGKGRTCNKTKSVVGFASGIEPVDRPQVLDRARAVLQHVNLIWHRICWR